MAEREDQIAQEFYPSYMEVIRYMVNEGELDEKTAKYDVWANRVAKGDAELAIVLGQLARISEMAYKQRYLEGQPMLVDVDSPKSTETPNQLGMSTAQRLHFLRHFLADYRALQDAPENPDLPGVTGALYLDPNET